MVRALVALAVAALVLAACDSDTVSTGGGDIIKGSGAFKTDTRPVQGISAIRMNVFADVTIERTGTESLSVTADDNILPVLRSDVRDGALTLTNEPGKGFSTGRPPSFRITVGALRQIELAGAGTIRASKLGGDRLALSLVGSGTLSAAGDIDDLDASLTGSGTLDAAQLKAKRAKARLSGSGKLTVNADELDALLNGSGIISYVGTPKLSQTVNGSGRIQQR